MFDDLSRHNDVVPPAAYVRMVKVFNVINEGLLKAELVKAGDALGIHIHTDHRRSNSTQIGVKKGAALELSLGVRPVGTTQVQDVFAGAVFKNISDTINNHDGLTEELQPFAASNFQRVSRIISQAGYLPWPGHVSLSTCRRLLGEWS